MHRKGRRTFLAAAGVLLVAASPARAQRGGRLPRTGFLSPTVRGPRDEAFMRGLRELGYVDLVVNAKTANRLGLALSTTPLLRAGRVIG